MTGGGIVTIAFFDSSAFIKLLVEEPGRHDAVRVWDESDVVAASRLASPEVSAALAAARRASRLDARSERRARSEWDDYWAATQIVELTPEVVESAATLAVQLVLGGADAVHLATALTALDVEPVLVTWDRRLAVAAVEAGVASVPSSF